MIDSIYQIDFITIPATGSPTTISLLSHGDGIEKEIEFPLENKSQQYTPVGAAFGKGRPMGGARRVITFGRYVEHGSHAAAAAYCLTHPASLAFVIPGKIRVTIPADNGSTYTVFDILDAVIIAAIAVLSPEGEFATYTTYRLEGGKTVPV